MIEGANILSVKSFSVTCISAIIPIISLYPYLYPIVLIPIPLVILLLKVLPFLYSRSLLVPQARVASIPNILDQAVHPRFERR